MSFDTDSGSSSSTKDSSGDDNKSFVPGTSDAEDLSEDEIWKNFRFQLREEDFDDDVATGNIADHMADKWDFLTRKEDKTLFVYDEDNGVYKPDGKDRLSTHLAENLSRQAYSDRVLNSVIEKIRPFCFEPSDDIGNVEGKLCLENGVLDISEPDSVNLDEYSPDDWFTSSLPVEANREAECPQFEQYLSDVVPEIEDRQKLQEFAGYCLHHWDTPYNRALLLVGPTQSGKSVFLGLMNKLLGEQNVLNKSLQRLSNQRFAASGLPGTIVNIDADLGTRKVSDTGIFKKFVAGDRITVEAKYKDAYDYKPTQKHLFSANEVPEVSDADDAFYERWVHVSFPRTIPREERNPQLLEELTEELPGVLNWALEGYSRLMSQEGFTAEKSLEDKQALWRSYGDSISRFIETEVVEDSEEEIPKSEVYEAYRAQCNEDSKPVKPKQTLTKRLGEEFDITQSKVGPRDDRYRVYKGITLAEHDGEVEGEEAREFPI